MNETLAVIARFNEDLSWVKHLECEYIIFNKGEDFPYEYDRFDVPNIGRESETFIRFIVDFYEILDKYDYVCFLQGNPFDHCEDALDQINTNIQEPYIHLADKITGSFFKDIVLFEDLPLVILNKLNNINVGNFNLDSKSEYDCADELTNAVILLYLLNIPIKKEFQSKWSCGAQYKVSTKAILNKSENWWIKLYQICFYLFSKNENSIGYTIEQIWPLIWNHETKD
jgi:hypothetical protein